MEKPKCSQCRHYFITWNPKTPNGCRRYSIQSKEKPSIIVAMAGLGECQGFEAKISNKDKSEPLDLNNKDLW